MACSQQMDRSTRLLPHTMHLCICHFVRQSPNPFSGCSISNFSDHIAIVPIAIKTSELLNFVQLTANDGPHHLHGGSKGWDKVIWQGNQFQHKDGEAVKLTYRSSDGEQVWNNCCLFLHNVNVNRLQGAKGQSSVRSIVTELSLLEFHSAYIMYGRSMYCSTYQH